MNTFMQKNMDQLFACPDCGESLVPSSEPTLIEKSDSEHTLEFKAKCPAGRPHCDASGWKIRLSITEDG